MQYELILTGKFKKSLKLAKKRGLDLKLLDKVITMLQNDIPLEEKYRDHELKGKYQGFRECHIQPDWLLIYLKENNVLTLTLVDTGTHADLFNLQRNIQRYFIVKDGNAESLYLCGFPAFVFSNGSSLALFVGGVMIFIG